MFLFHSQSRFSFPFPVALGKRNGTKTATVVGALPPATARSNANRLFLAGFVVGLVAFNTAIAPSVGGAACFGRSGCVYMDGIRRT